MQSQNKNQPSKIELSESKLLRLSDAISQANIGMWEYTPDTQKCYFSGKLKELIGVSITSPFTFSDLKEKTHPNDQGKFDVFNAENLQSNTQHNFDLRLTVNKDELWFSLKSQVSISQDKKVTFTGTLSDCTCAKETASALKLAIHTKNNILDAGNIGQWQAERNEKDQWIWRWDKRTNEVFAQQSQDIDSLNAWGKRLHPDDQQSVLNALKLSLTTGEQFDEQYRTLLPNGEIINVHAKAKIGRDNQNNISWLDGICVNQTAFFKIQAELQEANNQAEARVHKRTQELQQAKERAEQANQTKSAFLSMMSHELRTPMNAVLGSLDLLSLSKQTPESKDLIETATTSAQNLIVILNDILDINKIEAGKMQLEQRDFSIAEIIDNVIKVYYPIADGKQIKLRVKEDPLIPNLLEGDAVKVRQIIFNLLGNALKFTSTTAEKQGEVLLDIHIVEHNNIIYKIAFSIIDNGIGIEKKTQQKLFTPFIQAQLSTTREYGGTGLGLAICGNLAQLMGGQISLTSSPNEGATFKVELPFWRSKSQTSPSQDLLDNTNIAVINLDESENLQQSVIQHLESEGAQTRVFKPENIPANIAESDMILLLAHSDKVFPQLENIYHQYVDDIRLLIAVSREEISTLRNLLPQSTILPTSPMTRLQLLNSVKNFMDNELCLELDELELDDLPITPKPMEEISDQVNVLVVEDNPLNQKLIVKQLSTLGYQCDLAKDGLDGIKHWENTDYKLILTDCHMPNLDGYDMTKRIRDLEKQYSKKSTPIVAVTGAAMTGDEDHCLSTGMNDFVSKPILLKDLKQVIEKWYAND
ncbi:hypothetical protein GCM10007978_27720 [Shewanella hanedai]|uniref:histidine kinase n=1 Tax=Shewanella hanedai TaxID=25 RepID=A0A553JLB6_SHEHA|nr:PAS domain-containing hybrid sensor histidine kinase/response regulator [Shewanella hanedai]TRY13239.1 response regulator [Shewanella hanedai]GGI88458.1 hypothetical protein GCM10007978_27720 [Shewanella hanedai]